MPLKPQELNRELASAVDSFHRERIEELCRDLVKHLRHRDDPYPLEHSKTVLKQLRKKRYFDLLQQVADALIQNGQNKPIIRRQYAQSQLDQSNLTAAIGILEKLEEDTAEGGVDEDPAENAEVRGLLGRGYKQLYVDADEARISRNRAHLEKAIAWYRSVYDDDPDNPEAWWHGINAVALLHRAEADEVELRDVASPKLLADSMATEILAKIETRHLNAQAHTWNFATAVEACVGLGEGKHEEALDWLSRYLKSDYVDAFELASTYRQLREVWKLEVAAPPGDRILPTLKSALLRQQGSKLEIASREITEEQLGALVENQGLEKILGREAFQSLRWLRTCMARARAVARVETKFGDAVGTGFLVRGSALSEKLGDEAVLLTNAHVISDDPKISSAIRPRQATFTFELWNGEAPEITVAEVLWSSPPDELDATLVRLSHPTEGIEPMPVTEFLPARGGEERAYIIGHPQGRRLSFSIHDNYLLDYDGRLIHYRSPTDSGSSGSPVFDSDWELIGLHHRGLRQMPRLNGQKGTYPANEGIWIQAIRKALAAADPGN